MTPESLRAIITSARRPFIAAEQRASEAYDQYSAAAADVRAMRARYEKINNLHSVLSDSHTWSKPTDVRGGIYSAAAALGMEYDTVEEALRRLVAARISALILAGKKVTGRTVSEESQHALAELIVSLVSLETLSLDSGD
tara:strand:- start:133 stop:552 length:420 start_codon:yes stop_codon:yes gene_type:complete